jgi:ATP-dependent DNA helicase RecG
MTEQEIFTLLQQHEWKDVEFKEAKTAVPKTAYETVSAFANTEGGHLVFGVKKEGADFEVVGVLDVDKVQNDFITSLRQPDKISQIITVDEHLHTIDEKDLLIFYVPEAPRTQKPVYINGSTKQSFLRKGACDVRCSHDEMYRLLRDASNERYDGEVIEDILSDSFFDEGSLRWYRTIFNQKQPGRHETLSDKEFLLEWGFLKEHSEKILPTRAAILFFGKERYVRQILPRPVVDYQRIDAKFEEWIPEKRWNDRQVSEQNLIQTWLGLLEKYTRISEKPFAVDFSSMRRSDNPPDYISFRESVINLLMHQDYGDHSRMPAIQFFYDRTIFKNPGDAFASREELLEPWAKEVRNPSIVNAFRRIGLSDQAGTGIRSIFQSWSELGNVPPLMTNSKAEKTFELCLLKEKLLSEEQLLFQSSLGVHLSDIQAKVFAFACRNGGLTITDIKAITGKPASECKQIAEYLSMQVLLKKFEESSYVLAAHLKGKLLHQLEGTGAGLQVQPVDRGGEGIQGESIDSIAEAGSRLSALSENQREVIKLCTVPRSLSDIQAKLKFGSRSYFKNKEVNPLLVHGLLKMTNPENPNASNQKYVTSESGLRLVESWNVANAQVSD